jgi:hypothetical protein
MKRQFVYFEGGVGDLIRNFYETDQYDFLQDAPLADEDIGIVLACHNPYAHEFFTYSDFACHYDIRLAGHHLAHAIENYLDPTERKEYICDMAGVNLEDLRHAKKRVKTVNPSFPFLGTMPLINNDVTNILIILDAALDWKSIPLSLFYSHLLPYIHENPQTTFHLVSRCYRKYFDSDYDWHGYETKKFDFCSNLNIVSPTLPDTLHLARKCDLIITPHSCLAQFAAYEKLPCIVCYPPAWDEFQAPKFGTAYTKSFTEPNFQLLPFNLFTKDILQEKISKGISRPF